MDLITINHAPLNMTNALNHNALNHKVYLSPQDFERLRDLRAQKPAQNIPKPVITRGAALADWVAETVGSWRFIR